MKTNMGQKWHQSKAYDLGLGFILHFKGLWPLNLKKGFRRLNDFSSGVIGKCGIHYKIAL
jgi:hypothetical protein